jgi:hypothetical protein
VLTDPAVFEQLGAVELPLGWDELTPTLTGMFTDECQLDLEKA